VLHHSLGSIFSAIAHDESTPPLYYIVTWLWTHVFGYSEFSLRFPSAIAGIALVWVVYRAGCELGGARTGLAAGLLAALNPLLVWYSQEARAYAFLALWGGLSFYLTIRQPADESSGRRQRWCWAVVAVLALCTHYFAIFFLVPEAVWLVARARRPPWLQLGLVTVVGLALLPLAIEQRSLGHTDWINGTPLRTRAALIPKQFVTGLSAPHQTALAFCALAAVAIALIALARSRLAAPREALLAGGILIGTPIVMVLLAAAGVDLVLTRNAIGILPIGLLAAAVGFERLSRAMPPQATALLVAVPIVVGAFAIASVDSNAAYQRPDWRAAGRALTEDHASQLLILEPASTELPLGIYVPLRRLGAHRRVRVREVDVLQFLLTTQGGRARQALARVPHGFRAQSESSWPDLRLIRYVATRSRVVSSYTRGAASFLIPGR
jgi:mannosyltransferase